MDKINNKSYGSRREFKNKYRIESIRLKNWDYSNDGAYFITICTKNRMHHFGKIKNGIMGLNYFGCLAHYFWKQIPNHFSNVFLDEWIIMPNHVHGILVLQNDDNILRRDVALQHLHNSAMQHLHNNASGIDDTRKRNYTGKYPKMSEISPKPKSIPAVIRSYKSVCTKTINKSYGSRREYKNYFAWQSLYYDHIIRNDFELNRIRKYILNNPKKWERDINNNKTFA